VKARKVGERIYEKVEKAGGGGGEDGIIVL